MIDFDSVVVTSPIDVKPHDKIILPGVGSYSTVMARLVHSRLDQYILDFVEEGGHVLGICLGMQLLVSEGEENGFTPGLGLISGKTMRLPKEDVNGAPLRVPHIGWAEVTTATDPNILQLPGNLIEMYFAHSFHVVTDHSDAVACEFQYGGHTLTAAIRKGRVLGVQFHPERSGPAGLDFLKDFMLQ